jgi:predicted negative regulator of RcsB-dependent stress response
MKREERRQAKRNDLATLMDGIVDIAVGHSRQVVALGVVVLLLLLGALGLRSWLRARDETGARMLADLIDTYDAPITSTLEDLQAARPDEPTFTSVEERARKVMEIAGSILERGGPGTARAGALLYRGLAESDLGMDDEAEVSLAQALGRESDGLYGALARLRLARLKEARRKCEEALPLYQAIAEGAGGVVPREEGMLGLARCQEALGRKDEAVALYRRLVDEFPDSEYLAQARRRLSDLS